MADNLQNNKKPLRPAPPLNAQSVGKASGSNGKSVYDEIAERRISERHKIGVTAPDDRDGDVKVYTRNKAEKQKPEYEPISDEENFDIPIPPKRKKLGIWAAVIIVLSAMCVFAGITYCAVNGAFDGLIKML